MTVSFARSRRAFSLVEIVVTVAILAVLATIFVSNNNPESANDRQRYAGAADELNNLAASLVQQEPTLPARSFRQVVGVYPGKLSDLTTLISTSGNNLCGSAYTAAQVTAWQNALNPFYERQLLASGTPVAPGFTVQDLLVIGSPPSSSGNLANTIIIRLPSVTQFDAVGLDLTVDGVVANSSGRVRYTAADPTVLDYYTTISVLGGAPPPCT